MTTLTAPADLSVQRWDRVSVASTGGVAILVALLALVPVVLSQNATQKLTSLFILMTMAVMWNALAGFGGLVSVGQQGFIGLGAYATFVLVDNGVAPYLAMVLAALFAGAVAVPTSVLVLRLRGGQFAIGTWVVAEVFRLVVTLDPFHQNLGGGTGRSLIALNFFTPQQRQEYTYWLALGTAVVLLAVVFVLLRSRMGASLQAIRDDEVAAASVGVRVMTAKRILFLLAAVGCGAAGSLTLANTLFVQPTSIFNVDYSAYMIFMVLVGGLGTFEGPIVGAILLFVIQNEFADQGVWYLVGLGTTAIVFALGIPQGVWGAVVERFGIRLLPVGYRLRRR